MKIAARAFAALAAIFISASCRHATPASPRPAPPATAVVVSGALPPSPRLIVGRVVATDIRQGFAFVQLGFDVPVSAMTPDLELTTRTLELEDTARLRVSRYVRGRTLGTTIVTGKPSPGDEVVWLAP